jgi:HPt (histidine-containing phosphotransfer) domain-containing protein
VSDPDVPGNAQRQVRAQVSALGEKFLHRTRAQAIELRELVDGLSRGDPSVLVRLQEMAHKIHGSGAMFGFAAISERGEEIERLSERIAATHTLPASPVEASELQRLTECIDQLVDAIEAAAPRPHHS